MPHWRHQPGLRFVVQTPRHDPLREEVPDEILGREGTILTSVESGRGPFAHHNFCDVRLDGETRNRTLPTQALRLLASSQRDTGGSGEQTASTRRGSSEKSGAATADSPSVGTTGAGFGEVDESADDRPRASRRSFPKDQQLRIWVRDAWHCRYCLRPLFFGPTLQRLDALSPGHAYYHAHGKDGAMLRLFQMGWSSVDHLTPVAHGGSNEDDNLVAACMECNITRGAMPREEKERELKPIPRRIRQLDWDGFCTLYPKLVQQRDEWTRLISEVYGP